MEDFETAIGSGRATIFFGPIFFCWFREARDNRLIWEAPRRLARLASSPADWSAENASAIAGPVLPSRPTPLRRTNSRVRPLRFALLSGPLFQTPDILALNRDTILHGSKDVSNHCFQPSTTIHTKLIIKSKIKNLFLYLKKNSILWDLNSRPLHSKLLKFRFKIQILQFFVPKL